MQIETTQRVFVFGKTLLKDLAPELSPTRSAMVYQDLFPELARYVAMPDKVSATENRWYFNLVKIA